MSARPPWMNRWLTWGPPKAGPTALPLARAVEYGCASLPSVRPRTRETEQGEMLSRELRTRSGEGLRRRREAGWHLPRVSPKWCAPPAARRPVAAGPAFEDPRADERGEAHSEQYGPLARIGMATWGREGSRHAQHPASHRAGMLAPSLGARQLPEIGAQQPHRASRTSTHQKGEPCEIVLLWPPGVPAESARGGSEPPPQRAGAWCIQSRAASVGR